MFLGTEEILTYSGLYSQTNRRPACYVYFVTDGSDAVKIGVSMRPWDRLSQLQIGNPNELTCPYLIPCKSEYSAYRVEELLHHNFADYHIHGEWFRVMDKLHHEEYLKAFPADKYWKSPVKTQLRHNSPDYIKITENDVIAWRNDYTYTGPMFVNVFEAAQLIGASIFEIEKSCESGKIPHLRLEDKKKSILVNMRSYAEQMREER